MNVEIAAIIVSVIAVAISGSTYYVTLKREKVRDTIKAYEELQSYLVHFYEYDNEEIEVFVDDRQSEEYKALSSSLAHIEIFATGIRQKLYSFDTIYKLAHGFLDGSLRDRIEYLLEMKSDHGNQFYINTKWLLEEMDRKALSETA